LEERLTKIGILDMQKGKEICIKNIYKFRCKEIMQAGSQLDMTVNVAYDNIY